MEQNLISSLNVRTNGSAGKTTKKEPISVEKFQSHLSQQTKKPLTEKEPSDKSSKKIEDQQDNELKKEDDLTTEVLFSGSFLTIQEERIHAFKLVPVEGEPERAEKETNEYIKTNDKVDITSVMDLIDPNQEHPLDGANPIEVKQINNTIEKEPTILFEEKKISNLMDAPNKIIQPDENKPLVASVVEGEEQPKQVLNKEKNQDGNSVVSTDTKEVVSVNPFDSLVTSRLLTKEWIQVKQPTKINTISGLEESVSSEVNESIKTSLQLEPVQMTFDKEESIGVKTIEAEATEKEKFISAVSFDEIKQQNFKSGDGDSNRNLIGTDAISKSMSEPIEMKAHNEGSIKQRVTHEVNQLISREVEQAQTKGQSHAKVSISPKGLGEITISLELKDNVLSTKIMVENLKTQELLTGGVPKLSDNLNRHSIQIGEVTIQLATSDQNNPHFDQRQHKKMAQVKRNVSRGTFTENTPIKAPSESNGKTGRLSILV